MPTTNNNLYDNRYTRRRNTYEEYPQPAGVYTDEQIANVRYDAFGRPYWISPTNQNNPLNELPRDGMNVLSVNVQIPNTYAKYKLEKVFPNVTDDRIDDILDDEWNYFGPDIAAELRAPGVTGEFKTAFEINTPIDFHATYILYGPSTIDARIAAGQSSDDVIKNTFCVFFIRDSIAYPIPNYKTLEVMLVENGKSYSDIKEATLQEMTEYDFTLDGAFAGDQTITYTPDPVEEFQFRTLLNRSNEWSTLIRYKSGYRPTLPFTRDPGDYIKPLGYTGTTSNQPDLFVTEDPTDSFFDITFQQQTYKEKLREKFEGKLIILNWPTPYASGVLDDGTNVATSYQFGLRMMIHGYWKQVTDPNVLKLYATINNFDLSEFDDPGTNGDPMLGPNGLINLLVQQRGITVINYFGDAFVPIWNDFPHIYDVDDVDLLDYQEYLDYWSNGNKMFDVYYLNPYEPKGSIAYYPFSKLTVLQGQLVNQYEIDYIRPQLLTLWQSIATKLTNISNIANSIPGNFTQYFFNIYGESGDIFKVMNAPNGDKWKFVKRKNNGELKALDDQASFLRLLEKNNNILRKFDGSEEMNIVNISKWGKTVEQDRLRNLSLGNNGNEYAANAGIASVGIIAGLTAATSVASVTTTTLVITSLEGAVIPTLVTTTATTGVGLAVGAGVVATAALLYFGLQTIMGEALDDKYDLPRNKYIYNGPGGGGSDRLRTLMNGSYTDAMILNELAVTVSQLEINSTLADEALVALRQSITALSPAINEIESRINSAEGIEEFQLLLADLQTIDGVLDSYISTIIPIIQDVKTQMDSVAIVQMQKYYDAIQYTRKIVYERVGINNTRGIQWPDASIAVINKYLPGKTFDDYLPQS
jgi:hypothetical protein